MKDTVIYSNFYFNENIQNASLKNLKNRIFYCIIVVLTKTLLVYTIVVVQL